MVTVIPQQITNVQALYNNINGKENPKFNALRQARDARLAMHNFLLYHSREICPESLDRTKLDHVKKYAELLDKFTNTLPQDHPNKEPLHIKAEVLNQAVETQLAILNLPEIRLEQYKELIDLIDRWLTARRCFNLNDISPEDPYGFGSIQNKAHLERAQQLYSQLSLLELNPKVRKHLDDQKARLKPVEKKLEVIKAFNAVGYQYFPPPPKELLNPENHQAIFDLLTVIKTVEDQEQSKAIEKYQVKKGIYLFFDRYDFLKSLKKDSIEVTQEEEDKELDYFHQFLELFFTKEKYRELKPLFDDLETCRIAITKSKPVTNPRDRKSYDLLVEGKKAIV